MNWDLPSHGETLLPLKERRSENLPASLLDKPFKMPVRKRCRPVELLSRIRAIEGGIGKLDRCLVPMIDVASPLLVRPDPCPHLVQIGYRFRCTTIPSPKCRGIKRKPR